MDVFKILAELKAERPAIEEAILCLERLAQGWCKGTRNTTQLDGRYSAAEFRSVR
jgi:hypothetical protein